MGQCNLIYIEATDDVHIIETECILTGTKMSCSSYWIHISSYLIGIKYKTPFNQKHFTMKANSVLGWMDSLKFIFSLSSFGHLIERTQSMWSETLTVYLHIVAMQLDDKTGYNAES